MAWPVIWACAHRVAVAVIAACVGGATLPASAQVQDLPTGVIVSPILLLDEERLLEGTDASARLSAEYQRRFVQLAEENRQIEATLGAEELELKERRPTLSPEAFRDLADAFDAKVQRVRQEQDAKDDELLRLREVERQNFLRQILPIVAEVLAERGALMVLDRRAAFVSADAVDITDEVIARVNAALNSPDAQPGEGAEPGGGSASEP